MLKNRDTLKPTEAVRRGVAINTRFSARLPGVMANTNLFRLLDMIEPDECCRIVESAILNFGIRD